MNQWLFVIAAYAVVVLAMTLLIAWSLTAMRKVEGRLDELSDR
jgi:heme exporter protein CcmD